MTYDIFVHEPHINIFIVGLYERSPIQPNYQELPYIFHLGKHDGNQMCIYVLRVFIAYLVVPVNHSKLDFANLTQM